MSAPAFTPNPTTQHNARLVDGPAAIPPTPASAETTDLGAVADEIRRLCATARRGSLEALEAQLARGHQLAAARDHLRTDVAYGRWFKEQQFPFSTQWAWRMRRMVLDEAAVRNQVASQLATTGVANADTALDEILRPRGSAPAKRNAGHLGELFWTLNHCTEQLRTIPPADVADWVLRGAYAKDDDGAPTRQLTAERLLRHLDEDRAWLNDVVARVAIVAGQLRAASGHRQLCLGPADAPEGAPS